MVRLSGKVKDLLSKSRDAAILAVDLYNKPATRFKSYGYIVLMTIAWTSLLHAIFERQGIKYYHRNRRNPRLYVRIDGELKAWELSKCAREFFADSSSPIKQNLDFVIELRNRIEHRFLPALDLEIQGECQALLVNYEKVLVEEFGDESGISEYLSIPLQSITTNPVWQKRALKEMQSREFLFVKQFIDNYRAALDESIWRSNEFSFKVFLIPNIGGNRNTADIAIEYVYFDPDKPEEMARYNRCFALFKEKQVPVVNAGKLKPSDVANRVQTSLGVSFSASSHHAKCWKHYKVRPPNGDPDPDRTTIEYCHYDAAHGDYLYTEEWVAFLITELQSPDKQMEIFNGLLMDIAQQGPSTLSLTTLTEPHPRGPKGDATS